MAKPRDRWRVSGGSRKWAARSTLRWKAPWAAEAALLDERAAESVLVLRGGRSPPKGIGARGARQGASEAQSPTSHVVDNAAARWRCVSGARLPRQGKHVSDAAEAVRAPSCACSPGVGLPQGGPAPRSPESRRLRLCKVERGHRGDAGLGIERSTSARVVRTVAEVGSKHLLRATRGEPRGRPSGRGVARPGSPLPDEEGN